MVTSQNVIQFPLVFIKFICLDQYPNKAFFLTRLSIQKYTEFSNI